MAPVARSLVLALLGATLSFVACGGSGEDEAEPEAAGVGGGSGAGATGGTSSAGGSAGVAGSGAAGAAGAAGAGASAGASGKGGAAGSSGASGAAGTSGKGGAGGASGTAGASGAAGSSGTGGGKGGASGSGGGCVSWTIPDTTLAQRTSCTFKKGDKATKSLGVDAALVAKIPIEHVIVVMNENRSFDHYLGRLPQAGKADVDGWPAGFSNLDKSGVKVTPHHLTSPCLPIDPPHNWDAMHAKWNGGKMDGFVTSGAVNGSDGHYALGYYDEADIPFYYWLAKTFAISDRHFSSVIGPTWPNREYLYAGTSNGGKATGGPTLSGVTTLFDAMTKAGVSWHVYSNGTPRQDCMGWTASSPGVSNYAAFQAALADGKLPAVSFVDPSGSQDEHPANSIHGGEKWAHDMIVAAMKSPAWSKLAILYTYDEAGGLADHVPPPKACIPAADQQDFDRLGFRVPLYVVSPWARPGFVSHATHEHASITRFIELLHGLGALTDRDANADALLDLFDFGCPALLDPGTPPAPATGACPLPGRAAGRAERRTVRPPRGLERERVGRRAVLADAGEAPPALLGRGALAHGDPPAREAREARVRFGVDEPGLSLRVRLCVGRSVRVGVQRSQRLPDRHVEEHERIVELALRGVAAVGQVAPHEPRARVREGVQLVEARQVARVDRIVGRRAEQRDVDLRQVEAHACSVHGVDARTPWRWDRARWRSSGRSMCRACQMPRTETSGRASTRLAGCAGGASCVDMRRTGCAPPLRR